MKETEIQFLREQIKMLRRTAAAITRQIDHMETRIDDLRRAEDQGREVSNGGPAGTENA